MTPNSTDTADEAGDLAGEDLVGEAVFDPAHYYPTAAPLEAVADEEAAFLAAVLDADRLLDAPCGHGRHANRLAARGREVVGVDRSSEFLARARETARERGLVESADGGRVDYRQGDLRALPLPEDAVGGAYNVQTSFGFFDDAGNRRTLAELHRVLEPGGRLVLELLDRDAMLRDYRPESVTELEADGREVLVAERREYDPLTGRTHTDRTVLVDGEVHEASYTVRTYSVTELQALLDRVGFSVVEVLGDLTGADYDPEGPRQCLVAEAD